MPCGETVTLCRWEVLLFCMVVGRYVFIQSPVCYYGIMSTVGIPRYFRMSHSQRYSARRVTNIAILFYWLFMCSEVTGGFS